MDNSKPISTVCQTLEVLRLSNYRTLLGDHYTKKLFTGQAIQLHIVAQLLGLSTYSQITEQLRAHPALQEAIGLDCISASRLSAKIHQIPLELLQNLLLELLQRIHALTAKRSGVSPAIGRLHLIDATDISLPETLGRWARCGSRKTGVRLHVRVIVADPDTVFPDKIVPTTVHVRESKQALKMTLDSDLTCVLDRGYEKGLHLDRWMKRGIRFVLRIREWGTLHIAGDSRPVDEASGILRDIDVTTTNNKIPVRLVEFQDAKGRTYRLLTNRWDLPATEIAAIYRHRWQIELFFKWLKQHTRLIHLFSCEPEAAWNHLFLSLITQALTMLIQLQQQTPKSTWCVMQLLRAYLFLPWEKFSEALWRPPTRVSKGRHRLYGPKLPPPEPRREVKPMAAL